MCFLLFNFHDVHFSILQSLRNFTKPVRQVILQLQKIDNNFYPEVIRYIPYQLSYQTMTFTDFIFSSFALAYCHINCNLTSNLDKIILQSLGEMFVINSGSGFRLLWHILKPFLDPETTSKIHVWSIFFPLTKFFSCSFILCYEERGLVTSQNED